MFQPAFKMPITVYRLFRSQLDTAALKSLKITGLDQLAIQPWRRNLQHIRSAGYCILYIQYRAHLPAEVCAIFMRYAARLINENPQHARLASAAQLDLHNFHT